MDWDERRLRLFSRRAFTLIFLPIAWLLITRALFRADIGEIGGGLTLASAIEANGVSAFIGNARRGFAGLTRSSSCPRSRR